MKEPKVSGENLGFEPVVELEIAPIVEPVVVLEEMREYTVISITDVEGFVMDAEYIVSGNVANALIKRGLVRL